MRRTQSVWRRVGAGAVALSAATLVIAPAAAQAADDPETPGLVVSVSDLNTPQTRIGGGDRRPIRAEIRNEGTEPAEVPAIMITLPEGAALKGSFGDCTFPDYWPDDEGAPWVYGPSEATCVVGRTLAPGESLPLVDAAGRPAFRAEFGRNLWGPDQFYAAVSVTPGNGEVLASDDFAIWSRRNTLDVSVTVPPVRGTVGDTVDLSFEVVNHGPSDGGGPGALITAPSGTVILPSEWCWTEGTDYQKLPESKQVRCNFESYFPTIHSGYGRVGHTVPLKIKSAPGRNGTVRVSGTIIDGTESRPGNNTARIVVR
ncbi:hypothetical protein KOI35_33885 [Actinoplanes bogorensis]|uniref:DUF11 domain-containing protein n=1 Tax=Paractinoplanes bogorensis TaxID=1610840 RepID=A0ABS5YYI5_9ACTN|nr:hypothetical protein [Actinoplanes bogorensis]MBU2668516.1 hypothetical protein [Actinoplanes bogorensis]